MTSVRSGAVTAAGSIVSEGSVDVAVSAPGEVETWDDGRIEVRVARGLAGVFSRSSRSNRSDRSVEVDVLAPPEADTEDNGPRGPLVGSPVFRLVSEASDFGVLPGLAGPVDDSDDEVSSSESGAALATP
ncbi:hypothetical protein JOF57_005248 [Mycolicibacterium lutetiense]|uniref:Uncharacterized protein n=1 Tax=Mycolicibacterium lutetiense TaxID=1641992 RepID=A0ABS5A0W4_9MYCO|nr:hypothetical protein [Mycolicibacterium lutetiense]